MVVKGVVVTGQHAGRVVACSHAVLELEQFDERMEEFIKNVTTVMQTAPIKVIRYKIFMDYFWIPIDMERDEALREIAANYRPISKYLEDWDNA